jgi:hypothetical protein
MTDLEIAQFKMTCVIEASKLKQNNTIQLMETLVLRIKVLLKLLKNWQILF